MVSDILLETEPNFKIFVLVLWLEFIQVLDLEGHSEQLRAVLLYFFNVLAVLFNEAV